jgi:hypothetical protein
MMENKFNVNQKPTIQPTICGDVLVCCTGNTIYGLNIYDINTPLWSKPIFTEIFTMAHKGNLLFIMGNLADFDSKPILACHHHIPSHHPKKSNDVSLIVLDAGTGKYINAWKVLSESIEQTIKKEERKTSVRDLKIAEDILMVFDSSGNVFGYDISNGNIPTDYSWHIQPQQLTAGAVGLGDNATFYVTGNQLNGVNV